jgi:flagellar protein FlgJ
VDIASLPAASFAAANTPPAQFAAPAGKSRGEVREAFDSFVGQTFFTQLLAEMRKSVAKPAYLHGGATEEVFQGQLDQVLSEKLSEATADQFSGPMFELFMLPR